MAQAKNVSKKPKQEEKIWGALSYLWILSVVALAARKNNEYIRFHANQGFLLFIISLFLLLFGPFGFIIYVVAIAIGVVKAMQGQKWVFPVIGQSAVNVGKWFIKTVKL